MLKTHMLYIFSENQNILEHVQDVPKLFLVGKRERQIQRERERERQIQRERVRERKKYE